MADPSFKSHLRSNENFPMNDPTPFEPTDATPIEARIVAWVLGEASAFETAELERLCQERPELRIFHRRMQVLHGLITEAESQQDDPSWKLPEGKRKPIDEISSEKKIVRLEPEIESHVRRGARRALIAIAACLLLAFLAIQFLPRDYETKMVIEVKPRTLETNFLAGNQKGAVTAGQITPMFFSTEFEKIKSRNSLGKVVDNLDLTQKWNVDKETAVKILKKNVITQNIKGTDLISIRVRNADAVTSKDICQEVGRVYQQYRIEAETKQADQQLYALNKAIRDQEDKVEERRKVLAQIVRTKGIIYRGQDSIYNSNEVFEDQGAHGVELTKNGIREEAIKRGLDAQDYVDAKNDFESDQKQLQQMKLAQVEETIQNKMPPQSVEVHDEATTSKRIAIPFFSSTPPPSALASNSLKGDIDIVGGTKFRMRLPTSAATPAALPEIAMNSRQRAIMPAMRGAIMDSKESAFDEPSSGKFEKSKATQAMKRSDLAANDAAADRPDSPSAPVPLTDIPSDKSKFAASRTQGSVVSGQKVRIIQPSRAPSSSLDALVGPSGSDGQNGLGTGTGMDGGLAKAERQANVEEGKKSKDQNERDRSVAGTDQGNPIRTNPALTHEHTQNVDKVRHDLYAAEGNFNLGKYDDSKKSYEDVLKTDPYNSAARRGLEKINSAKSDYRAAYDQTRAELLTQVDDASELKVSNDGKKPEFEGFVNYGSAIQGQEALKSDRALDEKPDARIQKLEGKANDLRRQLEEPSLADSKKQTLFKDWKETQKELNKLAEPTAKPKAQQKIKITPESSASDDPYSTFSLNISDVSFQVAKTALEKDQRPDPADIKPEQFYNAVDYGDAAPASNEPVAATIEEAAHPIVPGRTLVRIALKTGSIGRAASQPLRLTLLVDQSGSMSREDRLTAMNTALKQLGTLLTKNDHITVIGFSREAHLLADSLPGDQAAKLEKLVNQTASEGGTNLESALKLAGQLAVRHLSANEQNRIVLFTDGAANLGNADPQRLAQQVTALRQQCIAVDIAGIGTDDLNDRLLSELARHGNGRYYVAGGDHADDLARQLAGAFRPAAENVKVQVHFNPGRVGQYKLIGFEKDRLTTADFRNDAVDAAELAADEAGVALYQVETLPQGRGEIGEVSVRFKDSNTGQMVERKWTVPYDSAIPPFDRASPSMQLAGLSMLVAQKLQGGPLADAIDFKELATPRANVKQFYANSNRVAEMLWMIGKLE